MGSPRVSGPFWQVALWLVGPIVVWLRVLIFAGVHIAVPLDPSREPHRGTGDPTCCGWCPGAAAAAGAAGPALVQILERRDIGPEHGVNVGHVHCSPVHLVLDPHLRVAVPGDLGLFLLVAEATGLSPTNFGGVNLISALAGGLALAGATAVAGVLYTQSPPLAFGAMAVLAVLGLPVAIPLLRAVKQKP